jgi:hypothetical protein
LRICNPRPCITAPGSPTSASRGLNRSAR